MMGLDRTIVVEHPRAGATAEVSRLGDLRSQETSP
jgi:hypothetical protein